MSTTSPPPSSAPFAQPSPTDPPPLPTTPYTPQKQQSRWQRLKTRPCFRSSLLIAIAAGTVFGLARYAKIPNTVRAGNGAVGAFVVWGAGSWTYCQAAYHAKEVKVKQGIAAMNMQEARRADVLRERLRREKEKEKVEGSAKS